MTPQPAIHLSQRGNRLHPTFCVALGLVVTTYPTPEKDIEYRSDFRGNWIVDEAKISQTDDAIFMHCLPVRRNVIVTDGVIDSANSVVIDEAENRLHIQKAIMSELIK